MRYSVSPPTSISSFSISFIILRSMHTLSAILSLPTSFLLLLSSFPAPGSSIEPQWPYNLPPHVKYFPDDEPRVRRNAEIQRRMENETPFVVRKMSADEGEIFLLEYWGFGNGLEDETFGGVELKEMGNSPNASWDERPQPPLLLHTGRQHPDLPLQNWFLRPRVARLDRRDFTCPDSTSSCASINRPNSCCGNGLTCEIVINTGLGDVGCCATGTSCSGEVAPCQQGYTTCPASLGGGCCIPGYQCSGVGCNSPISQLSYVSTDLCSQAS